MSDVSTTIELVVFAVPGGVAGGTLGALAASFVSLSTVSLAAILRVFVQMYEDFTFRSRVN